jgi:acetolactate synthase-1/2/3 large subunit
VAWTAAEIAGYRRRVLDLLTPRPETHFAPQHLIDSLRRVMSDDGVVSCDVGSHKLLICQQWRAERPRTFLVANGGSAMGYGLGSALAAALLDPTRPVATVIGDGGFLMYPGDLETLQRTGARATVIVLVDRALALIRTQQQRSGAQPYGVEFGQPDYAAIGRAFGLPTSEIDRPDDCDTTLTAALAVAGPSLVVAHVDASEYRRF